MPTNKKKINCSSCNKDITEIEAYTCQGRIMCEDCALHTGLFPLGHTGHLKKAFYIKDRRK